ncbi:7B2, putative [Brugia malayi]|uniref:Neuroendocrine protein 7B2 n=1 Tax=Brugia malayi TaxID=6279 RepID=A0A1P6C5R3_BRUMA|nr:7B2, putative [Brugia malayi]AAZ83722.1 chaperone 7B2 precursor [Brugia malayi]CRZ24727.1 BMA-SBT-1 [Brugia malayi]VIO99513.1 7B2, putative [Brugia malayi]
MAILLLTVVINLFACFDDTEGIDLSHQDLPEFIGLISRGIETIPSPLAFGHKYMTGGAGEGSQLLRPDSDFEEREKVKSDNILPSYCEPPNPCPLGYTAADGCLEEFENSAEFSRNYQARQTCICDQEHMFNCPDKKIDDELMEESLQSILNDQGLHKTLIAKKFHEKRSQAMEPRRKRSINDISIQHSQNQQNPYFKGEILKSVIKKDGRNIWQ